MRHHPYSDIPPFSCFGTDGVSDDEGELRVPGSGYLYRYVTWSHDRSMGCFGFSRRWSADWNCVHKGLAFNDHV
jgi:hypothetical protein